MISYVEVSAGEHRVMEAEGAECLPRRVGAATGSHQLIAHPLTPRLVMWALGEPLPRRGGLDPNPLASALLAAMALPVHHVYGTACVTGYDDVAAAMLGLTDRQLRGLQHALSALRQRPAYLSLHVQAARITEIWHHDPRQPQED